MDKFAYSFIICLFLGFTIALGSQNFHKPLFATNNVGTDDFENVERNQDDFENHESHQDDFENAPENNTDFENAPEQDRYDGVR